jgi:hypothetical protein
MAERVVVNRTLWTSHDGAKGETSWFHRESVAASVPPSAKTPSSPSATPSTRTCRRITKRPSMACLGHAVATPRTRTTVVRCCSRRSARTKLMTVYLGGVHGDAEPGRFGSLQGRARSATSAAPKSTSGRSTICRSTSSATPLPASVDQYVARYKNSRPKMNPKKQARRRRRRRSVLRGSARGGAMRSRRTDSSMQLATGRRLIAQGDRLTWLHHNAPYASGTPSRNVGAVAGER